MLKKLIKYDILSVWRLWWIAAATVPVAAFIGAFSIRALREQQLIELGGLVATEDFVTPYLRVALGFAVFASIVAIILSCALTTVLVCFRFYKNLYTDEGYLTFTLPVTRKQILFSKTLNAFIWLALQGILIAIAMLIFFMFGSAPVNGGFINFEPIEVFARLFVEMWDAFGAWSILMGLEFILWWILSTVQGIAAIYLSITIGAIIAKKAKIIASIGIYYLVNGAVSLIWNIAFSIFLFGMLQGFAVLMDAGNGNEQNAIICLILMIAVAFTGIISTVLYTLTQHLLDRKLNLA